MLGRVRRVHKRWGHEDWVHNSPMYCGKLLHVDQGGACSLHYHERKHETFNLLSGRVVLELYNVANEEELGNMVERITMEPGDVVEIQPYIAHRFTGLAPSVLLEVSTQHFNDDNVRLSPSTTAE